MIDEEQSLIILPQILFSTGDVLAQQLVEKRGFEAHDPMRTARMGAYGGGTALPSHTHAYT
jgi:protein Mpv17